VAIGTAAVNGAGSGVTYTFTTSTLAVGTSHSITATYDGDAHFAASAATAGLTPAITKATVGVSITSPTVNPLPFGVKIPGASSAPSLSNMILVRGTEPFHADDDPAEPLHHGNQLLTPNLSGQLAPGAKDVSVFSTFTPIPTLQKPPPLSSRYTGMANCLAASR